MANAQNLHLIRHGPVIIDRSIPSAEWQLAPGAKQSVLNLAARFRESPPDRILSSSQAKAKQTAQILGSHFGIPIETREGLEEHHRGNEVFFPSEPEFRSALSRFFEQPDEVVFGSESATDALTRFRIAVNAVMDERHKDEFIVTHGTVMSLLLACNGGVPLEIWKSLTLPDHRVVRWPNACDAH